MDKAILDRRAEENQKALEARQSYEARRADIDEKLKAQNEKETNVKNNSEKLNSYIDIANKEREEQQRKFEADKADLDAKLKANKKKSNRAVAIPIIIIIVAAALALSTWKVGLPHYYAYQAYNGAVATKDAGQYEDAIAQFEAIGDFRDSLEQIEDCKALIVERDYNAAIALFDEGKFEEAKAAFEALNGYKECANYIAQCDAGIETQNQQAKLAEADGLVEKGKYDEAIAIYTELGDFENASSKIPGTYYVKGNALLAKEDYVGAVAAWRAAGEFEDAAALAETYKYVGAQPGDVITFGQYPGEVLADKTVRSGAVGEWIVLTHEGEDCVMISKDPIDAAKFSARPDSDEEGTAYEVSNIRIWAKNVFAKEFFSETDLANMVSKEISIPVEGGDPKTEKDLVWLLSAEEQAQYAVTVEAGTFRPVIHIKTVANATPEEETAEAEAAQE